MSMLSRFASLGGGVANIQYVGGYATSVPSGTTDQTITFGGNLTGGIASSASAGDLVIVYFGVSGADVNLVIADYVEVADLYSSDTDDSNLAVGWKIMGSTPDTTVTLTGGTLGSTNGGAIAIQVWRNVDPYLPLDVAAVTATGTNSVLCDPPAITPSTTGAIIVAGGVGGHEVSGATFSSSNLSGFISAGSTATNVNDATIGLGYATWTSGTFNPNAFTFSGSNSVFYSWAAVTLALRPAGTQPGPFAISAAQAQTGGGVTTITINKPAGTREGDLMVAAMFATKGLTWNATTGWTEVADQGATPSLRIAYKVAGPSEGASYAFTTNVGANLSGAITTYRNADYDAIGSITTAANPLVVGAVTASVDFSRIYAAVARDTASITITGPATMQQVVIDNDITGPSFLIEQDATLSLAGSSGTRSFTVGSTTAVAGVLASIKPAASYTPYVNHIGANFVAGSTSGGPNNLIVTNPTIIPGNLIFCFVSAVSDASAATVSLPSGYTSLASSASSGANNCAVVIGYRFATGDEGTSTTATYSSSSGNATAIATITVAGGNTPLAPTVGSLASGSSTTLIDANTVTATANGLLLFFGTTATGTSGAPTFTLPSGYTLSVSRGNNSVVDMGSVVAYKEGNSAGATGTVTATASLSGNTKGFLVNIAAL